MVSDHLSRVARTWQLSGISGWFNYSVRMNGSQDGQCVPGTDKMSRQGSLPCWASLRHDKWNCWTTSGVVPSRRRSVKSASSLASDHRTACSPTCTVSRRRDSSNGTRGSLEHFALWSLISLLTSRCRLAFRMVDKSTNWLIKANSSTVSECSKNASIPVDEWHHCDHLVNTLHCTKSAWGGTCGKLEASTHLADLKERQAHLRITSTRRPHPCALDHITQFTKGNIV